MLALSRSSHLSTYTASGAAAQLDPAAGHLVQPVRDEVPRSTRGDAARDLHLLGLGFGVAVNEESEDANEGPGRAAVVSTLLLVAIYLFVSAGAQAYHGTAFLANEENASDVLHALGKGVLGAVGVKFLIVAVLTSASASTQTTILPTARTTLSMAKWGAIPRGDRQNPPTLPDADRLDLGLRHALGRCGGAADPDLVSRARIRRSSRSGSRCASTTARPASPAPGTTGESCSTSARKFFLVGLAPLLGGVMMYGIGIYAIIYYGHKEHAEGKEYLAPDAADLAGRDRHGDRRAGDARLAARFRAFFSRKT